MCPWRHRRWSAVGIVHVIVVSPSESTSLPFPAYHRPRPILGVDDRPKGRDVIVSRTISVGEAHDPITLVVRFIGDLRCSA